MCQSIEEKENKDQNESSKPTTPKLSLRNIITLFDSKQVHKPLLIFLERNIFGIHIKVGLKMSILVNTKNLLFSSKFANFKSSIKFLYEPVKEKMLNDTYTQ